MQRPSRTLWIAAIAVSVVCIAGLAYGLVMDWNTEPVRELEPAQHTTTSGGGFGVGLAVGIGAGIVIGSLVALRGRK